MARPNRTNQTPPSGLAASPTTGPCVTYTGPQEFVELQGQTLYRDQATPIPEALAKRLKTKGNPFFEVSGVEPEQTTFATADAALDAERARHKAEIDDLTRLHSEAMERQAESMRAGWEQQHQSMQAEIDDLKAQLAGPKA